MRPSIADVRVARKSVLVSLRGSYRLGQFADFLREISEFRSSPDERPYRQDSDKNLSSMAANPHCRRDVRIRVSGYPQQYAGNRHKNHAIIGHESVRLMRRHELIE